VLSFVFSHELLIGFFYVTIFITKKLYIHAETDILNNIVNICKQGMNILCNHHEGHIMFVLNLLVLDMITGSRLQMLQAREKIEEYSR
jgi:hypothetical protein